MINVGNIAHIISNQLVFKSTPHHHPSSNMHIHTPHRSILVIYLIALESSAYQLGSELQRGHVSLEAIGSLPL